MWIHQRTYICSIDVDVSDKACLLENLSEDEKAERTHKDITSDEPHSAQCVYLCSWPHTNKTLTSQIETLEVHSLVMSRLLPFCSFLSIRLWRIFIFHFKIGVLSELDVIQAWEDVREAISWILYRLFLFGSFNERSGVCRDPIRWYAATSEERYRVGVLKIKFRS